MYFFIDKRRFEIIPVKRKLSHQVGLFCLSLLCRRKKRISEIDFKKGIKVEKKIIKRAKREKKQQI